MRKVTMPPLSQVPLTDQIIDLLQQEIENGGWAPGTQIPPQTALAAELGVSVGTVREALKVLLHSKQLEVRRAKGTFVRSAAGDVGVPVLLAPQVNPLDAADVRRALELEACELACKRRTLTDLAKLRQLLSYLGSGGGDAAVSDERFHAAVVDASHNKLIGDLLARLTPAGGPVACSGDGDQVSLLHLQLTNAIEARDEDAARRAVLAESTHSNALAQARDAVRLRRRGYASW